MSVVFALVWFIEKPATVAALAAAVALAWPIGRRFARRHDCRPGLATAYVFSVLGILALTLLPNRSDFGTYPLPPQYVSLLVHDPAAAWAQIVIPPLDSEQLGNIALYVPAGLLGALAWRSRLRAVLAGTALTVLVETCQYGIIGRAGSLTDIRNNAFGAILGAMTATFLRRFARTTDSRRQTPAASAPSDTECINCPGRPRY